MLSLPSLEFHVCVVTILNLNVSEMQDMDSLRGSSFDLFIHSGQRPFYLLTAIQPAFLFPCETCFLSETGEVLITEKEITF